MERKQRQSQTCWKYVNGWQDVGKVVASIGDAMFPVATTAVVKLVAAAETATTKVRSGTTGPGTEFI